MKNWSKREGRLMRHVILPSDDLLGDDENKIDTAVRALTSLTVSLVIIFLVVWILP